MLVDIGSGYRFPSLLAVDTFSEIWTANYKTANKKANNMLKLKDWFFNKDYFWTANKRNRRQKDHE